MPGRNPEAQERSERVAAEIRAEMARQNITHRALREKLATAGMDTPNDMWVTRRMTGEVNLVEPVKVVYGPTDELVKIAAVLGVDPDRWIREINYSKSSKPAVAKPAA